MAWLLVQLKLRLLRNALRASTGAKVAFILSTIAAALVAVGVFVLLAALRGHAAAVDLTTVIFTVFAFGWLILPLIVFGLDSTLDPATLALYPLRTRPLAVGLLAASAAGAWPLANVLGLLGATVGLAHGALGLLVAVLAVLLQVLFCITLARFVTTALAGLLRSRRGRDLAALLIIPIFALYEGFTQVVPKLTAEHKLTAASFAGVDSWLRWLPPGLAAHAIQDASDGHPGAAGLRLALLAAVIVALGWLWIRALGRALVTADTSTQPAAVRGKGGRPGRAGRSVGAGWLGKDSRASTGLPFARYGLTGTVAARFWLYQRRDPSSFIIWAITAVIMAVVSISTIRTPHYFSALFTSALFGGVFVGIFHANSIGMAGPGFGLDAMALAGRRALRAWFCGLDLALALIAVPLLALISFSLAAVAGHPADGFFGLATDLAGIGAGLALADVFSVSLAYPAEKRPGSPTPRAAGGYTGRSIAATFCTLFAAALLVSPVVVVAVLTRHDSPDTWRSALVLCAACYGFALAWAGVRIAATLAEPKVPELYQIAARSKL